MSVVSRVRYALITAAALAATTLTAAPAAPAAPAPAADSIEVTTGRLVLSPGERGYRGLLPVSVYYRGAEETYLTMTIVEPVPGSFDGLVPSDPCWWGTPDPTGRRIINCGLVSGNVQPGERRRFDVGFEVLTTPRNFAMVAGGGSIEVRSGEHPEVSDRARFRALFRSTTGSLVRPRPYVRDTRTDISTTAGPATLTRQADGTFAGRVRVTARYGGDAPHDMLFTRTQLPAGVSPAGVEPAAVCPGMSCEVAGGAFMPGESRTVELLITAPAETAVGPLGSGTVTVGASWSGDLTDVDPADDTATFTVTAVEAG